MAKFCSADDLFVISNVAGESSTIAPHEILSGLRPYQKEDKKDQKGDKSNATEIT
jgi:hypothetical protein